MTSGPCVVMAIEGENAVARYREVMGPTDSAKAPAGTIRQTFRHRHRANAVHGSDAPGTAKDELAFFFAGSRPRLRAASRPSAWRLCAAGRAYPTGRARSSAKIGSRGQERRTGIYPDFESAIVDVA